MKRGNKGFTLIELLVSLVIITIALFAFFKVINSTTRINTKNDRDINSLNIAQSEIEDIRAQIKNSKNGYIKIKNIINPKTNKSEEILIPIKPDTENKDENIEWIKSQNSTQKLNIKENGMYKDYIYDKGKNKITYKIKVEKQKIYTVVLGLTREPVKDPSTGMYLYNIDIENKLDEEYFSKKNTDLTTSILDNNTYKGIGTSEIIDTEKTNFSDGVAFFRIRTSNIIFGRDINSTETNTIFYNLKEEKTNHIKLYITEGEKEFDAYAELNGERKHIGTWYDAGLYGIKGVKINPNSTGGINDFEIENLNIKSYLDNRVVDSYSTKEIIGEDYSSGKDLYEYPITINKEVNGKKSISIEFDYSWHNSHATVDFIFGK